MALINVVEWDPNQNNIYAWKYPHTNLSTATQLIVHESQEAVFFSKGKILGKFGPGKHTLTTENLPLLRNLYGIPFGGKNPFVAEVWFVNKTAPLDIDWETTTMRFLDPDYGQMIPLIAKGRYGLKVQDAERFLVQLVGTLPQFTAAELTNHFKGPMITKTNTSIMSFMTANGVGINQIAAYLNDLSEFIQQPMAEFWEKYGFKLEGYYVTEVNLDTSTPEGRKISEAMADRSAQAIAGYTWQQKQSFNVANNAVSSGSSMGIMGVAMMAGGFGGGGIGNSLMQTPSNDTYAMGGQAPGGYGQAPGGYGQMPQRHVKKEVFCSNCSKKFPATNAFCPYCGNKYNPCPVCGADNSPKASRCVTCGAILSNLNAPGAMGNSCPKCGTPVDPGLKFCPTCGTRL